MPQKKMNQCGTMTSTLGLLTAKEHKGSLLRKMCFGHVWFICDRSVWQTNPHSKYLL